MRVAAAVIALGLLSGCAAQPSPRLTVLPTANGSAAVRTPTPATATGSAVEPGSGVAVSIPCVDGVATIGGGGGGEYMLSGDCARVEVSGAGLTVRVDGAVESLVVRGEQNGVDARGLTSVIVEGQRNRVAGDAAGSVTVRGDDNTVASRGEIGAVDVAGSGNSIQATRVGSTQVSGDGNAIAGS